MYCTGSGFHSPKLVAISGQTVRVNASEANMMECYCKSDRDTSEEADMNWCDIIFRLDIVKRRQGQVHFPKF